MKSKAGPWNDFEMVKPWGIRNKQSGELFIFESRMTESQIEHHREIEGGKQ